MKILFKIIEVFNIIAVLFLLAGAYGIAITGFLQIMVALLFVVVQPKNKLIYCYFGLVAIFFLTWDHSSMDWLFALPIFLVFFLTFIIYRHKKHLNHNDHKL